MEKLQVDTQVYTFYNCFEHPDEAMTRTCIDKHCDDCTLVCPLCIQKYHPGHRTQPIKVVLKMMTDQRTLQNYAASIEHFKRRIEEHKQSTLKQISLSKAQLDQIFDNLMLKMRERYDKIKKQIITEHQRYMGLTLKTLTQFKYTGHCKLAAELINEIAEFKSAYKVFKSNETVQDKLQKQTHARLDHLKTNLDGMLSKLHQNINQRAEEIIETLELKEQKCEIFNWSPTERHADIMVKGKVAWRQDVWKIGSVCIMIDKNVSTSPPIVHEWMIRIKKISGVIDLGLCQESKIKKNNYLLAERDSTGSGNYLIRSIGEVVSSDDRTQNKVGKCFDFGVGDQITIRYDICLGALIFIKNKNDARYEMKVNSPAVGQFFRPCAYIGKKGDSVEIIDKKL